MGLTGTSVRPPRAWLQQQIAVPRISLADGKLWLSIITVKIQPYFGSAHNLEQSSRSGSLTALLVNNILGAEALRHDERGRHIIHLYLQGKNWTDFSAWDLEILELER
ncbi:hypothetical protein EK904_006526 [Melospiza melodia maxima]|nr:hypothetical protein EK904_006526 [Melospiza melodia maxima]